MDRPLTPLDRLLEGKIPAPPVARLLGFEVVSVAEGTASVRLDASERHHNPMGTTHGGILCDIADAAMGIAYASTLGAGESFTTIELKINFLKPIRTAVLTASAKMVKGGRTIGLVECDIHDQGGSLVARASSTCLTLRGESARGRIGTLREAQDGASTSTSGTRGP
jgi:uncharacterized protein (TIGR00369 family)